MSDLGVAAAFEKALAKLDHAPTIGLDDVRQFVKVASAYHGDWQGMPVPVEGMRIRLAPGHPLEPKLDALNRVYSEPEERVEFVCSTRDIDLGYPVNQWTDRRRNRRVLVMRDPESGKAYALTAPLPPDGSMRRFLLGLNTLGASDGWSVDAELRAQEKLRGMLSDRQWRHYQLVGSFLESSSRSGLTYWLRRLRPTIAMTPRWPYGREVDSMRCLAVLCLHPVGYYEESWAGCMTPSDDVIAHLLLIRADEAGFWGKANQHDPADAEAGL